MKILSILILIIVAFATFAQAHKGKCPSSPYLDVAPSDLIQAKDLSPSEKTFHEKYMRVAIQVAIENNSKFGAAIVHKNGTLMCTGVNVGGGRIYHGEIKAIMNCTTMYGKLTWEEHFLYTTGEPCPMCSAAAMWSKFDKVIFASYVSNMYCERCFNQLPMDANEIFKLGYGINHNAVLIGGVLEEITDTFFPSLCGNLSNGWAVVPLCSEGWNRGCPRPSRYFGWIENNNNNPTTTPVPTTTPTTTPTPTQSACSANVTQKITSQWYDNSQNYIQVEATINNVGTSPIKTFSFNLNNVQQIWNADTVSAGVYKLPNWLNQIDGSHTFGYIQKSSSVTPLSSINYTC